MKIHVLGSGGWFPNKKRETCSIFIDQNPHGIFIDAGSGLTNLFALQHLINKMSSLHIVLTHYHHDHLSGLPALPQFLNGQDIIFYGPGAPWYPEGCQSILSNFLAFPYFSLPLSEFAPRLIFHDYGLAGFKVPGYSVKVNPQVHADPSFGLTFGNYFHYATDTEYSSETFRIASACNILFHECWAFEGSPEGHTSIEEIIEGQKHLNGQDLYLMHIPPFWTDKEEGLMHNILSEQPQIKLLKDGMEINI